MKDAAKKTARHTAYFGATKSGGRIVAEMRQPNPNLCAAIVRDKRFPAPAQKQCSAFRVGDGPYCAQHEKKYGDKP